MGFPNPRKVTVLALIPLSLGNFLGFFAFCYWTMGYRPSAGRYFQKESPCRLVHLRCGFGGVESGCGCRGERLMEMGSDGDHGFTGWSEWDSNSIAIYQLD